MSKAIIGSWLTINNFSIVEIMASCDFDWLCIDLEHTFIDYSEMTQMILALNSKNIDAYVRVGKNDPLIIKRALDAGADGIIIPAVNSYEEALKAVEATFYPPQGKRGVGLGRAQSYGFGFEEYLQNKSKKIKLIVQIEHYKAVQELHKILSIEEITGSFIGPYDLSGSLGMPGQWNNVIVKESISNYESISSEFPNKLMGYHVIEPKASLVSEKIALGYNFIAFSLDSLFLGTKIREQLSSIKQNQK